MSIMDQEALDNTQEQEAEDQAPDNTEAVEVQDESAPQNGEAQTNPMALMARELIKRTAERDALQDQMLRLRAEFDNSRKRTAREIERIRKTASESLLVDLLPVVDNLERALNHANDTSGGFERGVAMVLAQMKEVLARTGLEAIPAQGEAFDPNVHEAVSQMPSDEYPADVVMEECVRGYRIGKYIVRPAKVVVSSGPAATGPDTE
jgi:molecular chaperone GrpE